MKTLSNIRITFMYDNPTSLANLIIETIQWPRHTSMKLWDPQLQKNILRVTKTSFLRASWFGKSWYSIT